MKITKFIQYIISNPLLFGIIIIAIILLYINNDKFKKISLVRQIYKDEFDNFDIQAHKHYITGGSYQVEQADAETDFVPKKTSKLVTLVDESIEEGIEW
jgi:hypothetical protein